MTPDEARCSLIGEAETSFEEAHTRACLAVLDAELAQLRKASLDDALEKVRLAEALAAARAALDRNVDALAKVRVLLRTDQARDAQNAYRIATTALGLPGDW